MGVRPEVVVVGAGIAGVMTAASLLRKGCRVQLVDAWEPGHSRASSSDYTRLLRAIHGSDELYTRWAREARLRWLELQEELGCVLYEECGALILAGEGRSAWEDATLSTFGRLGVPHRRFDADEVRLRFPQFRCPDVSYAIYEPEAGLLMARRAVVQVARRFEREGGTIRRGRVVTDEAERPLLDGKALEADLVVMAAGPWLGAMFRRTVHPISRVVRQDILYTSAPECETAYDAPEMPCWVDHGFGAYGTPSVEGCGVKAAIVWQEKAIDLDDDERVVDAATFTRTRQYLRHRLPGLAGQRAVDQKACQIAMTPDTHFIVDFHPEHEHVLIVGGCSGHLFKHGPVFGDFVAGVGLREWGTAERFRLGSRRNLSANESPSGR